MEDLGFAELPREGDMLLVGDRLVGEHHDQVLHPGVQDLLPRYRVERTAHVDAADFRAQGRMAGNDGDGHAGCLAMQ